MPILDGTDSGRTNGGRTIEPAEPARQSDYRCNAQ